MVENNLFFDHQIDVLSIKVLGNLTKRSNAMLIGGKVEVCSYDKMLNENETIQDHMHIDILSSYFNKFSMYFRDKEGCPFNTGNWMIEFFINKNDIIPFYCLKYRPEETKERMEKFIEPLRMAFKNKLN